MLLKRLKPTPAALLALLLFLALMAWVAWQFLVPHFYESPTPLTLQQAQSHSPIPLPASATYIRIATFHHWLQTVQYVRFQAPLADCLAHARSLLPGEPQRPFSNGPTTPLPFNPGPFLDLTPFDLRTINSGVQYGTGGPSRPVIVIDQDLGLFYYKMTD